MLNDRLDRLTDYPFQRLTDLLGGPADADCLNLSIGEPQHQPPAFVRAVLDENFHLWGKYPPVPGTPDFRAAVADWLGRRYGLPAGFIDGDRHVLPAAGTREALYMIAQVVGSAHKRSLVLLPNPFYQVYAGAAVMAGFEPVFVPADKSTGFLPDYTALPAKVLDRVALAFYCSPANPQGAVADLEAWKTIIALARRYGFYLAADECYSEIYDTRPPAGILQACAALDRGVDNVVVFNSLSKRSSAPGLRSGFVAGDTKVIAAFSRLRSY
ncbi:MAG: aminotransferase class I/II-fold pyridoxal phosphate-dependent enzyme, partial [Rhodospirillales bacterium]|nr:aminotransferase class I/II-fold pyridoxal phosphate-dependent enzyme [Rhodospirillales bacterium]